MLGEEGLGRLGRHHEEERLGAVEVGEVGGAARASGAGGRRAGGGPRAPLGPGHRRRVAAPEADLAALGGLRHRERGAEGAGAEDRRSRLGSLAAAAEHRRRRRCRAASAGGRTGRGRPAPRTAMRSAAAQAMIAPLSVQSASGGARKAAPFARRDRGEGGADRARWRRRRRPRRAPARRRDARRGRPASARRVFSARVSATAAWKPAQRSARSARVIPPCASTSRSRARRTAVLRPEKERSQPSRSRSGRGRAKRRASPVFAAGLDRGAAGLAEAEELRDLVEGLAGGVVDGAAEAAEALRPLDGEELAVAAGDEEHEVGEGDVLDQPRGQRVPGEVVDAAERQAAAGGDPLGEHHAGEHAADQPRTGGDRHRVDVGRGRGRRASSAAAVTRSRRSAWARAAISGTTPPNSACSASWPCDLRGEDLADRLARARAHHRDGGVVAAALDPEDGAVAPARLPPSCAGCGPQVTPARPRRNGGACPRSTEPPWPTRGRCFSPGRERQSQAFAEVLAARLPGRFRPVVAPLLAIVAAAGAARARRACRG